MAADNFLTNMVLDAAMTQPPMNEREKALRDLFVREYLVDYNAFGAAMRCGFMRSFAEDYAKKFLEEPYVQQQITLLQVNISHADDDEAASAFNKSRIYNGLMREAHYYGPGSSSASRVAALSKLATIEGMDAKAKAKNPNDHSSKRGGVMVAPSIIDVTDWEQTAVKSQEKLVHNARD